MSQRTACRIERCPRSVTQYRVRRVDDPLLLERLKALAAERRRFGYRRLTMMLRREGFVVNHKRIQSSISVTRVSNVRRATDATYIWTTLDGLVYFKGILTAPIASASVEHPPA